MLKLGTHLSFAALGAACLATILTTGAPAAAEEPKPEFTVIGPALHRDVGRISASINVADLNLATDGGRHQLNQRVRRTAAELCTQLGEPDQAVGMAGSCKDHAVRSAGPMVRDVVRQARLQTAGGAPPTSITLAVVAAGPAR